MSLPERPGHPGSAAQLVAELAMVAEPARRLARARLRDDAAAFRLLSRRAQAGIRVADAFAKLGGGSLLTATLLLLVNGQIAWPIITTAALALLAFVASIIWLRVLDSQMASFDHAADLIESALKEAER